MFALEKQTRLQRKQTCFILTLPVAGAVTVYTCLNKPDLKYVCRISLVLSDQVTYTIYTAKVSGTLIKIESECSTCTQPRVITYDTDPLLQNYDTVL